MLSSQMKKRNNNYIYFNKTILTNGASLNLISTKFSKNYQINKFLFKKKTKINIKNTENKRIHTFLNKFK